ncbi:hypothetical protein [Reinekea marinisedimentorum]|uniref:Uncharacterized protein n=1 Tax=Reinekea marinisedimentorum TaxID=230495 RepID=A0A4R3I769_9GAMM|nr:hypothetical protein [Reinekea marinisedimentorum]TCS39939.1 hypothetical protein BCF53_11129 [Reinekea marinisedimentorum]
MVALGGVQLSILEIILTVGFLSLSVATALCLKRIAGLQQQVTTFQCNASREIKMVNQGAIGLGRRFSLLEARLKKSTAASAPEPVKASIKSQVSAFELIHNQSIDASVSEPVGNAKTTAHPARTRKHKTQAEQSLSRWMSEQQPA